MREVLLTGEVRTRPKTLNSVGTGELFPYGKRKVPVLYNDQVIGHLISERYPNVQEKDVVLKALIDDTMLPEELKGKSTIAFSQCIQNQFWPGPGIDKVIIGTRH